jgi:hypothetical protein
MPCARATVPIAFAINTSSSVTAFGRDVEIVARPRDKRGKKAQRGHITFRPVAA